MIRFRQLQALHAIVTAGTVTAAARHLGVSQPAVSSLISQLETQSRLKLFTRVGGRLHPTPEAMVLYRRADTMVRGLEAVDQTVRDLQYQRSGQLQIVCTHALAFGLIPDLIAEFTSDHPDIIVSLQARHSARIQEWVAENLFDLGISELPITRPELDFEEMRFVCQCAIPNGHALSERKWVDAGQLDNVPFIAMGNEHMTFSRTREAFQNARAQWRIRCQTHLFRTKLDFVKRGLGVALIDPFTLMQDDGVGYKVVPFRPRITLDLAMIKPAERPLSQLARQFADKVKATLAANADWSQESSLR